MRHILLLTTGGTIAASESPEGLIPQFDGRDMIRIVPELEGLCRIDYKDILNLDSSNMQPEDWKHIARETYAGLKNYDGIVITHGTDTMAYTSSILSYMLGPIGKPVILTGSQLPITHHGTDGKRNIYNSFQVAVRGLPGVYIVFDGKVILGTRAVKVRTMSFNAFESINYPYAGMIIDEQVTLNNMPGLPLKAGDRVPDDKMDSRVFLLKLIPGMRPEFFRHFLQMGYKGLVIESFGLGGVTYLGRNLLPSIQNVLNAGIPVVITTQCTYEGTDLCKYNVGHKAAQAGVISGHDMTTEAAVTKLMWVLGHTRDLKQVREMMLANYVNEISVS